MIRRPPANHRGNDHLVLPAHRNLRVGALLEPFAAGLHDAALGVREVALRFRFRLLESAFVRMAPCWDCDPVPASCPAPGPAPVAPLPAVPSPPQPPPAAPRSASAPWEVRLRAPPPRDAHLLPRRPRRPAPTAPGSPPEAGPPPASSGHSASTCACSRSPAPPCRRWTASRSP